MKEKTLTNAKKKNTLMLSIRDFRNNFSKHRHLIEDGTTIIVCNRNNPIIAVMSFEKYDFLDNKKKSSSFSEDDENSKSVR
jgi:prevent-host-death family protein